MNACLTVKTFGGEGEYISASIFCCQPKQDVQIHMWQKNIGYRCSCNHNVDLSNPGQCQSQYKSQVQDGQMAVWAKNKKNPFFLMPPSQCLSDQELSRQLRTHQAVKHGELYFTW